MRVIKTIFETNSSTTHSSVVMPKEKYDKWTSGLYYYEPYSSYYDEKFKDKKPVKGEIYTEEQVLEFLSELGYEYNDEDYDSVSEYVNDLYIGFISWESWFEDEYLETDETYYTTPGGEEIVICCKYGRDG